MYELCVVCVHVCGLCNVYVCELCVCMLFKCVRMCVDCNVCTACLLAIVYLKLLMYPVMHVA